MEFEQYKQTGSGLI